MSYKQDDSRKWVKKTTQDALNRLFKPDPLHVSVEFKKTHSVWDGIVDPHKST